MPALLITLKNIILAVGFHFVKKYAAEMVYDEFVRAGEKLAPKTETKFDDQAVAYLKSDREEMLAIIKGKIL